MDIDIAGMVKRAKGILLTPKTEWTIIAGERTGHVKVLLAWLLPLSLIPAAAALIGFGTASVSWGIRQAVLQVIVTIGGAYLTSFIVNALAEKYASRKDQDQAFALIAYSYTPACLGGVLQIVPSLAPIGSLFGLYGLYLLYIGLPPMMKTPPEKNTSYFWVALLCTIGVYIALSVVLAAILMQRALLRL